MRARRPARAARPRAPLAGGCGLGAGESQEGGATLTVTRDFGTREVGTGSADPIPGGETVMRMLQRDFDVETRYGGGFVQQINGIAGGREDGRPVDWFYYVNGILADDGAAAHKLAAGRRRLVGPPRLGRVRRRARGRRRVPGAVPLRHRRASACRCGSTAPTRPADACDEVAERLGEEGVKAGRSAAAGFGGEGVLRIKVGRLGRPAQGPGRAPARGGPDRRPASTRGRARPATSSRCSTPRGRPCARSGRAPGWSPRRGSAARRRPGS